MGVSTIVRSIIWSGLALGSHFAWGATPPAKVVVLPREAARMSPPEAQLVVYLSPRESHAMGRDLSLFVPRDPKDIAAYGAGTRYLVSAHHELEVMFPRSRPGYVRLMLERWNHSADFVWLSGPAKGGQMLQVAVIRDESEARKIFDAIPMASQTGGKDRNVRTVATSDETLQIVAVHQRRGPLEVPDPFSKRTTAAAESRSYIALVVVKLNGCHLGNRGPDGKAYLTEADVSGGLEPLVGLQRPRENPQVASAPATPTTSSPVVPALTSSRSGYATAAPSTAAATPHITGDQAFGIWAANQPISTTGAPNPMAGPARVFLDAMAGSGALDSLVDDYRQRYGSGPSVNALDIRNGLRADLESLLP